MRIGLTYDLREEYLAMGHGEEETAEFDRPDTIDSIEAEIRAMGHETDRIGHVRALAARLSAGDRWEFVFNVAEGLYGVGREAQVPALLDAYQIPYTFSDPLVSSLTLHKGMAKHVMQNLGLPTTPFVVVEVGDTPGEPGSAGFAGFDYPVFVKPVAEGTAKGIDASSKVSNRTQLLARCRAIHEQFRQAAIVEPFLPGRELTVGIVGTGERARALGTLEVELLDGAEPESYTYVNKERCEELCRYVLADDEASARCKPIALAAWRGLGCRDGGRVDLRMDARGEPQILEINPLPGLHPEHSDLPILCTRLGIPYRDLIHDIAHSAMERVAGGVERTAARKGAA
jgi:D-alanine-D-alanine ligase